MVTPLEEAPGRERGARAGWEDGVVFLALVPPTRGGQLGGGEGDPDLVRKWGLWASADGKVCGGQLGAPWVLCALWPEWRCVGGRHPALERRRAAQRPARRGAAAREQGVRPGGLLASVEPAQVAGGQVSGMPQLRAGPVESGSRGC